jgi:GNAT superfamily N-acetyltransferase
VKKAAEGELIARTFGWDEAFQRHFHLQEWNEKRPSLIRLGGDFVGTVAITEGDGCIEVGQFFIRPEYQNRGIGTSVLTRVLERADLEKAVVRLACLVGNRTETLYRRHGFLLTSQTATHCHMERSPVDYEH